MTRLVGGLLRGLARLAGWGLKPLVAAFNRLFQTIADAYPILLAKALARRGATVVLAVALFGAALALIPRLGMELVPTLAQGEFHVELQLPPGAPLERPTEPSPAWTPWPGRVPRSSAPTWWPAPERAWIPIPTRPASTPVP